MLASGAGVVGGAPAARVEGLILQGKLGSHCPPLERSELAAAPGHTFRVRNPAFVASTVAGKERSRSL